MNNKNIEFIGTWEQLHNPGFKVVEFDHFRMNAGLTSFVLSPGKWIEKQISFIYANKADVLNIALFSKTAKQWRDRNPEEKGNIRDYANVSQLVCLANLEDLNAVFIDEGLAQPERLEKLNKIAISQMRILVEDRGVKKLGSGEDGE